MATETPANPSAGTEAASPKKGMRRSREIDVQDLERRVHLAELRAREVEAELRYVVANEKRKALKHESRDNSKGKRREKGKRRQNTASK